MVKINKSTEVKELEKCSKNIKYFADKYCKIFNVESGDYENIKLTDNQITLLNSIVKDNKLFSVCFRRAGTTTLYAIYLTHLILFKKEDYNIEIFGHSYKYHLNLNSIIIGLMENLPEFFSGLKETYKDNDIVKINFFSKLNEIKGKKVDLLLMDSFFISKFDEIEFVDVLHQKVKVIISNVPNGDTESFFYKIYNEDLSLLVNFKMVVLKWFNDFRYNKNLEFENSTNSFTSDWYKERKNDLSKEQIAYEIDGYMGDRFTKPKKENIIEKIIKLFKK